MLGKMRKQNMVKNQLPATFMKKINTNQGITLMALVITIIVLLILAGVTIMTLTGENGILKNSQEAKQKTEKADEKELIQLAINGALTQNYSELNQETLQKELQNQNQLTDWELQQYIDQLVILFSSKGYYYEISDKGELSNQIPMIQDDYAGDITKGGTLAGTEQSPYQINNIEDLVSIGQNKYNGKYMILTRDLNFSSPLSYQDDQTTKFGDVNLDGVTEGLMEELTKEEGFNPLKMTNCTFDGKGKAIKNIYINRSQNISVGLFNSINTSTVQNLTLSGEIIGVTFAGGIVGELNNGSKIRNCYNYANVQGNIMVGGIMATSHYDGVDKGATIENCKNYGTIISEKRSYSYGGCGGIAGNFSYGKMLNCQNYGAVEGECIGGIVGFSSGALLNQCRNYSKIETTEKINSLLVGGITGECRVVQITNCSNYGIIDVLVSNGNVFVGGIIGRVTDTTQIANCYNQANINTIYTVGGIVGIQFATVEMNNCYQTGKLTGETVGEIIGNCHNVKTNKIDHVYYRQESPNLPIHADYQDQVTALPQDYMKTQDFANELNANRTEHLAEWEEWLWQTNLYPYFK